MLKLAVVLLYYLDQINNLVAVTNFVVVPRNNLYEVVCKINTGIGIEDRGQGAAKEV